MEPLEAGQKREKFLAEMEVVVPWQELIALTEIPLPKSSKKGGRLLIRWPPCCESTFCVGPTTIWLNRPSTLLTRDSAGSITRSLMCHKGAIVQFNIAMMTRATQMVIESSRLGMRVLVGLTD